MTASCLLDRPLPGPRAVLLVAALLLTLGASASAQITLTAEQWDQLMAEISAVRSENAQLRADYQTLDGRYQTLLVVTQDLQTKVATGANGLGGGDDEFYIPRAPAGQSITPPTHLGDAHTKHHLELLGEDVYLGGYIDLQFTDPRGDGDKFFDLLRYVPLIYADVSENIKVAAEIEIEHGRQLEVEFAHLDYLINDAVNFRAGVQLLPLGKLNEVHDSPIQDLTARPLVDRYIIPTTLRDAGVGLFGKIGESFSYNATVTNGFKGLRSDGTNVINSKTGLRNAAPNKANSDLEVDEFDQINDELAFAGRVAYTPVIGIEGGFSALFDKYDEASENELQIYAVDLTIDGKACDFLPDNMEFQSEHAWANIQRDDFAEASGVAGDMFGYYAQLNTHFEPPFLDALKDVGDLDDDAHFTFVTRYGMVDLDDYEMTRTTVGLNFRPNATDTVFKLDYQFNGDSGAHAGSGDDDAILFSVASYF